ncbi:hypothetical protein AGOR_G00075290 [Albula goreensis]|uniref:Prospero domain-containing protein n=1 Tax=Albula goreensis TaxID=1534307 RepID=A0A8T3DQ05_9TELE|nr:hypothetical protein AGOR_G00075290 [Albula goreensis]
MDSPSDPFGLQPSQICPYRLYSSPPGAAPSAPSYPSSSPPSYPVISHLTHSSGPQNCSTYPHLPGVDGSFAESSSDREEEDGEGQEGGGDGATAGVPPLSHLFAGGKRRHATELGDWCQELVRMKRLRLESSISGVGERGEGEGEQGRGSRRPGARGRSGSREGRLRARQELKLKLQETRGKLLELQEKVWRVYGERRREGEEHRGAGGRGGREIEESRGGEDGGIDRDEEAEVFSGDEEGNDRDGGYSRKSLPRHGPDIRYNKDDNNGSDSRATQEGELDRGRVWLGCGVVRGEWEAGGNEGQKFIQALKQELGSAVARVIDRVVHLYGESRPPSEASLTTGEGVGPRGEGKSKPSRAVPSLEQPEALPLVTKTPQGKKSTHNQSTPQNPQLPQMNPGLPHLPPSHLPALLPTRAKDPFLPSYPPGPPPLTLPLLHYTMQHLFARSLSNLPLHKDCLSPDAFLDFRPHTPSFPPLQGLLGPLEPPISSSERGRDGGVRGVAGGSAGGYADGGDSSFYLPPGSISFQYLGLSPCHLKKAKLMFFYARYPSSNTLKTYFPDVKFNRCITSQLIKWFSNFREFFYIQMERFARQAVREGVMGRGETALRLRRDSELYRILNLHYNKSNDYHVPERFLEISELALREFFSAIQAGRDADPCWKKSIYKIICKLDSPVPDSFRLPGCPTDTHSTG